MAEAHALRTRLAALTFAVAVAHVWLLAGMPRLVRPGAPPAPAWTMRTIEASPLPAAVAMPAPAAPPAAVPHAVPSPSHVAARRAAGPTPVEAPPIRQLAESTPSTASPAVVAPAMRLHYKVTLQARGFSVNGEATLDWRREADRYEAELEVRAPLLPARTQRSEGAITAEGIAPQKFSERNRREEATHFDRSRGVVVFSSNRPDAALQPGAQDRLSVMLQLGALLAAAPASYPAGSSIAIQTASTRDAEPWVFTIDGAETLALPGGTVAALKLTRAPRREYDVKVELWLAPGMAYAPVRLRLTQPNGDWADQQWSSTDRG